MNDSWDAFANALQEECSLLIRMHETAQALTQALVKSDVETIAKTEQQLDAARKSYQAASGKRRGMQVRGFGTLTLRQVCAYAPRAMWPTLGQRMTELTTTSIALGITINNNKALIMSGMDRLMKVTAALQKAHNDGPGTYKRRGYVPPPNNSVLVSSKA
ncbi:MAG TPA: flagellar export chaperone FlgN [Candidatus Aquilonibacter sp.]|nr:flagellar export chaperone FlgN [Candidatus Aquilonibacter sp.]